MQSTKYLKRCYYIQLCLYIVFAIGFIIALLMLAVYRNAFSIESIPYLLIAIFSIAELGFLCKLIPYLKDLNSVRNNNFEEITGAVIRYKRNLDPESGQQMNTRAIICATNSNKEIELCVQEGMTQRNEIYTFIYLKHTKIGAVKEKNTEVGW